jgi:O-antigen/teichoic acid export membrane protein
MPFAAGLALFAADLVHYVLGDQWEPAVSLLAVVGISCGLGQVAFNWSVFMRAVDRTRPLFMAALFDIVVFALVTAPATLKWGLTGYAIGFVATTAVQIAARAYYMRSLFGDFSVIRQMLRAIAPTVPAAGLVLLVRVVTQGERSPAQVIAELTLYGVATIVFTYVFERRLITEILGYVRGKVATPAGVPAGV